MQLTQARTTLNEHDDLESYMPGRKLPSAGAEPEPEPEPEPRTMEKAGRVRFAAGRRRSLSNSDLDGMAQFGEMPAGMEPEPEPAEFDAPTPRDESKAGLTLERIMRDGSALDIRTDRVEKEGWLRVVEEAPWHAALRSRRKNRRARRASATAATITSEVWVVLRGLRLLYYAGPEKAKIIGSLKLDPGAAVGIDPTLAKIALVPGWVLAARTQSECNAWVMAITFNCHAAQLQLADARLNFSSEGLEAEELLVGKGGRSGSDLRW